MLGLKWMHVTKGNRSPKLTVVIPTFNEVKNITVVVEKIEAILHPYEFDILFVDDNSDDGTIEVIRELETKKTNVLMLLRVGRRGLAGACIEGILTSKSDLIAIMDCDLQHDEKKLVEMMSKFKKDPKLDLVVGSRHFDDGKAKEGLSTLREIGSKLAIWATQISLGIKVKDPMSGFFMVKRSSVIPLIENLQPNGFKILADLIASSGKKWKIEEIGYEFKKRQSGESKMNLVVVFELLALILSHLSFGLLSIRFILFGIVGFSGIFVQLISTFFLLSVLGLPFLQAHILSIFVAMTSNFSLNNLLTYQDRSLFGRNYFKGLVSFYIVCSAGALANVAVADFIFKALNMWVLASVSGAFLGAIWNFVFSSIFTWKTR